MEYSYYTIQDIVKSLGNFHKIRRRNSTLFHVVSGLHPPSRPQAKLEMRQHLGVWGDSPSESPEGSALWRTPRRRGCRAESCRCPRRTLPPSRPQAKLEMRQHLGVWGYGPSRSPEGSALWRTPRRRGCRAEPCRCPRRTLPPAQRTKSAATAGRRGSKPLSSSSHTSVHVPCIPLSHDVPADGKSQRTPPGQAASAAPSQP